MIEDKRAEQKGRSIGQKGREVSQREQSKNKITF